MSCLQVQILDPSLEQLYNSPLGQSTNGNSGYDLYLPYDVHFPAGRVVFVNFGIIAVSRVPENSGFYLYPRSSISKTDLRLANSVGIIDPTYRGCIIAALENTGKDDITMYRGQRLVQICMPDLRPFRVEFVNGFEGTERGGAGFGSTGQ